MTIKANDGTGSGGALSITAGTAGSSSGGAGGNLTLTAGNATPQGGSGYTNQGPAGKVLINSGGGYNGVPGDIILTTAGNSNWSQTTSGFGKVRLTGTNLISNDTAILDVEGPHNGSSSNAALSYGGNVRITSGNGNGLAAGSIYLTPGTGTPNGTVVIGGNTTSSGNISAVNVTASGTFTGSGSGLTGVSASGLAAGTYSNAYTFNNAANSFAGNGAGLTSLTGANVTGTVANATNATSATTATTATNATQLGSVAAANYARLDIGNSFTGNQAITGNLSITGSLNSALILQPSVSDTSSGVALVSGNVLAGYMGATGGNSLTAGVAGATIAGGGGTANGTAEGNTVTDDWGTVGGGALNQAGDNAGTVSDHPYDTVVGGIANTASGYAATVAGGANNTASGTMSFAAGYCANAVNNGTFVWSGNNGSGCTTVTSSAAGQFIALAPGGFQFFPSTSTSTPVFSIAPTTGNVTATGSVTAASFAGNGSGLTNVAATSATTASGLSCAGCVGNTQLGVNYALGDAPAGNALNALSFGGLAPSAFAPASGSSNYVAKAGDTMTGSLISPGLQAPQLTSRTAGESLTIKALNGTGSGGALSISAGTAGSTSGGAGGNLTLTAGNATPQGGTGYTNQGPAGQVIINGGAGYNGVPGDITLTTAGNSNWSQTSNGFGKVRLTGTNLISNDAAVLDVEGPHNGSSSNAALSYGGNVRITSGNGNGLAAGNIYLTPGTGTTNGVVTIAGNVGIGTTGPATTLQVVGDIRVGTSGTNGCLQNFAGTALAGTCSSDARLKTNIQPFSLVLTKLAQLQPVHFNWKTAAYPDYHFGPGTNSGLIAQEVEKVFPELVSVDAKGYKQVNYSELPYLMLQAIRELKAENDHLRAEKDEVQQQIATLEARLAQIEAATVKLQPK